MSRSPWLVIPAMFIAFGILAAGLFMRGQTPSESPRPAQAMAISTTTPAPTITATASPLPTVDYSSTWPKLTEAASSKEIADNAQRLAGAESTSVAAAKVILDITGTAFIQAQLAGTPTAQALEAENARQAADLLYLKGMQSIAATATAEANAAQQRQYIDYGWRVLLGFVLLIVVFFGIQTFAYHLQETDRRSSLTAWSNSHANLSADGEVIDGRATLIPQASEGGYSARRIPPAPAHIADNPEWIRAALAGESVAVDVWEKAGKYNGNYRELYRWLRQNSLLAWHDKMILNDDGIKAVSNHSPTQAASLKNAPLPSVPYTERAESAGGGGGLLDIGKDEG